MGCCASSTSSQENLTTGKPSSSSRTIERQPSRRGNGVEDTIELAFKAKRANVFAEGIDTDARSTYKAKKITKSAEQIQKIRKILFSIRRMSPQLEHM